MIDAHERDELKIKDEFTDSDGNLDYAQLMDDLDQYLDGEDDVGAIIGLRHEIQKRVEFVG